VGADAKLAHAALVLSAVGLSLIAFLGYVFVFTGLQEQRTQHQLLELFDSSNLHLKSSLLTGAHLSEGQPAALLEIPAIGLHQVVVKGSSATDLLEGPGLMPDTAVPGTKGNAVIAGRRSTAGAPFGRILDLRPDDRITVVTALGSFTYKVVSVGTAVAGSTDPISPSTQAKLTLVTSNPPILATGRAYVVSRLVSPAARAPVPRAFPSEAERGLSGDPSALLPAALWGVVFVGALFLTVGAYRRWNDKIWAIYLLSTPIVIAVALVCFENLLRLLPATL